MPGRKRFYQCPNCEAICGLVLTLGDNQVVDIRGNKGDLMTLGHVCPKGAALAEMRNDPDRLRTPMVRKEGRLQSASWNEAFTVIDEKLTSLIRKYGNDSVAMYVGHAIMRSTAFSIGFPMLFEALKTPYLFTCDSLDALPRYLVCAEMFGHELTNPVADIDRSQYLLIIGSNPMVSNASMWVSTNFEKRLRKLKARNGKLTVIDPRRTRTARLADRHHYIRPGQDQYFLLALLHILFRDELTRTDSIAAFLSGVDEIETLVKSLPLQQLSDACEIAIPDIELIANELASAESAAIYGRLGTTSQKYGTVNSWLIEVLNIVTGNLDKAGGVMFPRAPAFSPNTKGQPGKGEPVPGPAFHTRVDNMPSVLWQLPVTCLANEIEAPGDEKIRALITMAGNPASSVPGTERLDKALEQLDFLLSFDVYINETSRHADVILPGTETLERSYYGLFSSMNAVRNVARFSSPVFEPAADWVSDWNALLQVTAIASGMGMQDEKGLKAMEDEMVLEILDEAAADEFSIAHGIDVSTAMDQLSHRNGVERVLDAGIRVGPYGDGFGAIPDGLTLGKIVAQPNGIDLGPLIPRLPEVLRTPSGKVEMAPAQFMEQVQDILSSLDKDTEKDSLLLIGRREERSINSWGHNVNMLTKGRNRCTLQIHPDDAHRFSLENDKPVIVSSNKGKVETTVEISEDIMPGVVSLPHGWGNNKKDMQLNVARQQSGVNVNVLTDELNLDTLSGTAALNAFPVKVTPVQSD